MTKKRGPQGAALFPFKDTAHMSFFTRRMIAPILFGLIGAGILIGLGVWQLQRLEWKSAILAAIDARIGETPVPLPATADPVADRYQPVTLTGALTGQELNVLTSIKDFGAGYDVIAVLQTTEGRRVMVDLGFIAEEDRALPRPTGPLEITGNLHWPNETDSFTPEPDAKTGIWFARDVAKMATALQTEPLLIIARTVEPMIGSITLQPVTSEGIANDHLQYAITWFSLAVVWLGMTLLLLRRIRQRMV